LDGIDLCVWRRAQCGNASPGLRRHGGGVSVVCRTS
jgi:hypothetical protein